jgi:hypothetical protein
MSFTTLRNIDKRARARSFSGEQALKPPRTNKNSSISTISSHASPGGGFLFQARTTNHAPEAIKKNCAVVAGFRRPFRLRT